MTNHFHCIFRQSTGVPINVFAEMKDHLEPFSGRFKAFDIEEALTLLLIHLRHGDSYNYLHAAVNRVRLDRPIKIDTISKTIRKALLILAGPNPYQKDIATVENEMENQSTSQQSTLNAAGRFDKSKNCYYAGKSFDGIRDNINIGTFFRSNVGWHSHDMHTYISEGTSWFDRCSQQSRIYLTDLVKRLQDYPTEVKSSK